MVYKYNKLVRDKIPENIENLGKKCTYKILDDKEYKAELDRKLLEEANEFIVEHSMEEMADLLEVIEAIKINRKFDDENIRQEMNKKADKKGKFNDRKYLIEVEEKENNKIEDENRINKQKVLLDNITEQSSLKEIQRYVKEVNTIRGFEGQPLQNTMLLLTEEIGELAKAIRKNATNMCIDVNKQYNYDSIESEISDCLYVLTSVCNKLNIDMFKCLKQKEQENINRVWKN